MVEGENLGVQGVGGEPMQLKAETSLRFFGGFGKENWSKRGICIDRIRTSSRDRTIFGLDGEGIRRLYHESSER